MSTTFLRFPDQATFEASLPAGFVLQGETGSPLHSGVEAISIIGAIDALPGYHVNLLGACAPEWASYVITPVNPVRVFG